MQQGTSKKQVLKWMQGTALLLFSLWGTIAFAQLSPGDLSKAHADLEGMSNCTECHILGNKVSGDKCLACHTELKKRIDRNKGYHASSDIAGKKCTKCHSEHHGRKFDLIRFDKDNFNHSLAGFELTGAHRKLDCEKCHKKDFIADATIRKKEMTFLGLNTDCIACHTDYHQKTLSTDCKQCHNTEAFKPAAKFNHNNAKFHLAGKHKEAECGACHKMITVNGKEIRQFTGIAFASCTSCHKDVHNNKFGQNCTQCHNEQSFHVVKSMTRFDHDKTNFPLEGKHRSVDCRQCHKTKLTDHVTHSRCTDCHKDYHEGQFAKQGVIPDCSDCHSTNGFQGSSFSIERHEKTDFPLRGAHMATPCFTCHKKTEKWNFAIAGAKCTDCHEDEHKSVTDEGKFYSQTTCRNCHTVNRWNEVTFDHSKTGYELLGKHKEQSCRACHIKSNDKSLPLTQFTGLSANCTACHTDKHNNQFDVNGTTDCTRCHDYTNWKAEKFDHNNTRFPLDGKHRDVACSACHKVKNTAEITYIQYKLNEFKCVNCH